MATNHNSGHPIMDVVTAIGGSLVSITFAVLDHFFSMNNLEVGDIIFGYIVKGFAVAASIYTIRLVRHKIKNKNTEDDGEKR